MNKLINTLSLFLLSVITLAQDAGDPTDPNTPIDERFGNPVKGAPIDNYTFALIVVAVIMIAYLVYKQRQSKIA